MPNFQKHLVIMVKEAKLGRVKTRLAADIGAVQATFAYRQMLTNVVRRLAFDERWRTTLAVTPDKSINSPSWPSNIDLIAQGEGGLDAKMGRVFDVMPPGPVVIIGSDIPGITAKDISSAFRVLGQKDLVFGPADDGGYWLVGASARRKTNNLFASVRWSSENTLSDTLKNTKDRSFGLLRKIEDVDDRESFHRWKMKQ